MAQQFVTRKSNRDKPARVVIYGPEGVGKSTFGARAEKPVFISPEGGTDQLTTASGDSVDEIPNVRDWDSLRMAVKNLVHLNHDFKTLVIDSADWVENLCHKKIIGTSGKTIVTVLGGYGAGYRASQNMHAELLEDLSVLRDKKGMNIVVTAHAHVKAVKDPDMIDDYDAFEIKCHEFVSSLWREWIDALFFVRFKTYINSNDESSRARALTDGTRVIYTVKKPAFQAKNRYGMPSELEFTESFWDEFVKYRKNGALTETCEQILNDIEEYKEKITDEETLAKINDTIEKNKENSTALNQIRARVKALAAEQKE